MFKFGRGKVGFIFGDRRKWWVGKWVEDGWYIEIYLEWLGSWVVG